MDVAMRLEAEKKAHSFERLQNAINANNQTALTTFFSEDDRCKSALLERENRLLKRIMFDDKIPLFSILVQSSCFKNDLDIFLTTLSIATKYPITNRAVLNHLIAIAQMHSDDSLLEIIFYECSYNRNYACIQTLLQLNPFITYKGQTLLHFAAQFDDPSFFKAIASFPEISLARYLNLSDDQNKLAVEYIESETLIECFESIISLEEMVRIPREIKSIFLEKRTSFSWEYDDIIPMSIESRLRRIMSVFDFYDFYNNDDRFFSSEKFCITRREILKYSYFMAESFGTRWYFPRLLLDFQVHFIDEIGVDSAGLTIEWLNLLIESFFKVKIVDPDNVDDHNGVRSNNQQFTAPLFEIIDEKSGLYAPNNAYPPEVYKFAGSILAFAIYYEIGIGVKFIESIYRTMWDIEPFRSEEDLKFQHPTVYKNLQKDVFDDVDNAMDIDTKRFCRDLLYYNYKESIDAFADGFNCKTDFVFKKYFNLAEFKQIITGANYEADTI